MITPFCKIQLNKATGSAGGFPCILIECTSPGSVSCLFGKAPLLSKGHALPSMPGNVQTATHEAGIPYFRSIMAMQSSGGLR